VPRYFCSLPNERKAGRIPQLVTDDAEAIAAFVKRWDVAGRGTFYCVSTLKPGEHKRSRGTIEAIEELHVDLDPKDVAESMDVVDGKLGQLGLPPSEIRNSGHGRHVIWRLKEPLTDIDLADHLLKRLKDYLCGDPTPAHPAALLRLPGSFNTKNGERLPCRTLVETGHRYDPSDIADWLDDVEHTPALTRRPAPKSNGHDPGAVHDAAHSDGPIDVAARLASMAFKGEGSSSVHRTQLQCTASLLRAGCTLDHVVTEVLEATRKAVAGDKRCIDWNWTEEEHEIRRMSADFINDDHPELYILLPDKYCPKWEAALAAGKRPKLVYAKHIGWHVRPFETKGADNEKATDSGAGRASETGTRPGKRLVLQPFVPFDPATLPPRAWLYAKHYQRRTVSLTAGPGGLGKSSLVLVECIAMATCRNLLGEQPAERLKIWLHNGEDPIEEIRRRLAAICQHYRIPMEELQGQLWVTSGNEFPLRVAKGYSNLEINAVLVREISNAIGDNGIDVAAFDPLVTLHSVSEGDPGKMDAVVRLFAGIADEHSASIELNHHVRKPAAGTDADHDVHDIRGVMAITDAVRAARVLNRMNKADAENAGIDEIARLSHFRVDKAKGNYSPAQAATWRRFVSVDLPNTDSVGVVAPWDFPGQGAQTPEKAAADQQAERVFLQLLDKFMARGINVSTHSGTNYAPAKFAAEREATTAKVSQAALKAAMIRLLDAGRIRTEPLGRSDRSSHRLVPWQEAPQ
jgi:RecA-family ATPase